MDLTLLSLSIKVFEFEFEFEFSPQSKKLLCCQLTKMDKSTETDIKFVLTGLHSYKTLAYFHCY